jgi:riboflavin biosynthesis pyrimidine reductase
MRRLHPGTAEEDPATTYAELWPEPMAGPGPHVALGMVTSVDGGASVDGRTDRLGGAADRIAFTRLREACDVILVGAQTVRAEGYGPPVGDAGRRLRRRQRGRAEVPQVAIVSGSLDLDPSAPVFARAETAPLVLTTGTAAARASARLEEVAEVVGVGDDAVDVTAAVALLGERGLSRVLCEGGPSLAAQLVAADLVDEWFITVAPVALAGTAPRITAGAHPARPLALELVELREHEGELLLRYARWRG